MDTPEMDTPDEAGSTGPEAAGRTGRARRIGRTAVIGGVGALAVIGAATLGAVAVKGPQADLERVAFSPAAAGQHGVAGPLGRMDPAEREERRAEHLAELATELDVDADELGTAVGTLREERMATREARMAEQQAEVRDLLIGLGADPDAVDAHLAERAERPGRMLRRGPQA